MNVNVTFISFWASHGSIHWDFEVTHNIALTSSFDDTWKVYIPLLMTSHISSEILLLLQETWIYLVLFWLFSNFRDRVLVSIHVYTCSLPKYVTFRSHKSQITSKFDCLFMLEVFQHRHLVIKAIRANTVLILSKSKNYWWS